MIEAVVDKEVIKKILTPIYKFILIIGFVGELFTNILIYNTSNIDFKILIILFCFEILWIFTLATVAVWIFGYKIWEKRNLSFNVSYDEISQNVSENQPQNYKITLKNEKILRAEIKTITKNFMGIIIMSNDNRKIWIPKQVREYNEIVKELSL
jgi:hypothetical protein